MVSVIVLMVSPPWGQSWRLAALSLLTINLSDQVVMLYFLHTELSMNLLEYYFQQTKCLACWLRNIIGILLEYSICNRPSAWPAGRGLLIQSRSHCWRQIRGSAGPFAPWTIKSDTLFVKLILIYRNPKNPLLSDPSPIIV